MFGVIGFILTGLIIASFAFTFNRYILTPYKLSVWQFSSAYYILSVAFLIWGWACIVDIPDFYRFSVFVGDSLLMVATVLLLSIVVPKHYRTELVTMGSVVGAILIGERAINYLPHPTVADNILYFNTQRPVMIVLAAAFALVWLPVSIRVARLVTAAAKQPAMTQTYISLYVAAAISALLFLCARRYAVIVISFTALGLMYALLTWSNYIIRKTHVKRHGHGK